MAPLTAADTVTSLRPTEDQFCPEESYQDCDSETLEDLEDQADLELADDQAQEELDNLVDEAERLFPPARITEMVKRLRQFGLVAFMREHLTPQLDVRSLLIALGVLLPQSLRTPETPREFLISVLKTALHRLLQRRHKIEDLNTIDDALSLLRSSDKTIVLSGAGISTSCGIPDFRSTNGIYARLRDSGEYDLDDPSDMFDKEVFLYRPEVFYSFARDIYPSNFTPSPCHRFIRLLEERGTLLRNYSQNIDTLEQAVGIQKVLNCHGSFSTASCVTCSYQTTGATIKEDVFAKRVPPCAMCAKRSFASHGIKRKRHRKSGHNEEESDTDDGDGTRRTGILKPDITFFGEKLSDDFDKCLLADRSQVSLLLVMGTSLKVAPVSSVVGHLPHSCPVILINRTPIVHVGIDIMLLGDGDFIVAWLCDRLTWDLPKPKPDVTVVGIDSAALDASQDSKTDNNKAQVQDVKSFVPQRHHKHR